MSTLVSVIEASQIAKCSKATIYRWISEGKLQVVTVQGVIYMDGLTVLQVEASTNPGRPRHAAKT